MSLTIVLTTPLSDSEKKLPKYIVELSLPMESESCKGTIFTPTVTLVRADLEPVVQIKLEPKNGGMQNVLTKVQQFFGSHTGKQITTRIKQGLEKITVHNELNAPSKVAARTLTLDYGPEGQIPTLWAINGKPNWIPAGMNVEESPDLDSFREEMAISLCEQKNAGTPFPAYVVVYNRSGGDIGSLKAPKIALSSDPIPGVSNKSQVLKTDNGVPRKVIVKLNDAKAYTTDSFTHPNNELKFFRKYFVFDIKPEGFLVGESTTPGSIIGWVHKQDVIEWNTNQAIFFVNKHNRSEPIQVWQSPNDVGHEILASFEENLRLNETSEPFPILSRRKDLVEIAFLWEAPEKKILLPTKVGDVYQGENTQPLDHRSEMKRMDVVVVLDATRSMGPYLERTRARLTKIVDSLPNRNSSIPVETHIGIVAFRDYEDKDVTFTTKTLDLTQDRGEVTRFLRDLTPNAVDPGVEEAVFEGLSKGATSMSWGKHSYRVMLLVGDAPPHVPNDIDTNRLRKSESIAISPFFDKPLKQNIKAIRRLLEKRQIQLYAMGIGASSDMERSFRALVAKNRSDRYIPLRAASQFVNKLNSALGRELVERNQHVSNVKDYFNRHPGSETSQSELESLRILNFNPDGKEAIQTGWYKPDIGRNTEITVHISLQELQNWSVELAKQLMDFEDGKDNELEILKRMKDKLIGEGGNDISISDIRKNLNELPYKHKIFEGDWLNMDDAAKHNRLKGQLNNILILLYSNKLFNEYGEGWVPMDLLPGGTAIDN